jgi:hypothetical protein
MLRGCAQLDAGMCMLLRWPPSPSEGLALRVDVTLVPSPLPEAELLLGLALGLPAAVRLAVDAPALPPAATAAPARRLLPGALDCSPGRGMLAAAGTGWTCGPL